MICSSFDELINSGYDNYKDITGIYEKIEGKYVGKTFGAFYDDVRCLSKKLISMGLRGKNILICGRNSYNWMVAYLAVTTYVGVIVPIDKEWKRNDINNVLSALDISLIFYSDSTCEAFDGVSLPIANLENTTTAMIQQGRELNIPLEPQDTDKVCAIFFTSGTTAAPKKVELTEKNFFANSRAMAELDTISSDDRYMVSLPLSHIGTVFANFGCPISMGASLYITDDFKEIAEDLKLIRPTVLYGVPRVFEKLWDAIPVNKDKIRKIIKVSNFFRKIGFDIRKRIFAELHNSLGGAVRFAYNGAAKLDDDLIGIFHDMGLVILQAYGMTETTAIVSCDSIKDYKLGSVGKVLSNQVCKIIKTDEGDNGCCANRRVGEICVKGDNVAISAIATAGDSDGFLHTGDLGYMDDDGYLFIVGRKKRLIKLSNAKNVYPDELEELLLKHEDIQQAHVYEDNGMITASIVTNLDAPIINQCVENLNETLPHYKQIRQVKIMPSHSFNHKMQK